MQRGTLRSGNVLIRAFLVLFLCVAFLAAGAHADTFKRQDPGKGSVAITGPWQFHTSDDMAWANPEFDDSHWEQIRGDDTWGAQTHPGHTGFAWYRRRIEISGADKSLAILIPPVDDTYELYWNGEKIGRYGKLPPGAWWWAFGHSVVYALPVDASGDASGVLAIRVFKAPLASTDPSAMGGLNGAPEIGNHSVLSMRAMEPRYQREQLQLPGLLMAAAIFVAGLIALLLYLRERTQLMYLWLAIYLLADGLTGFRRLDAITYGLHFVWEQLYIQFIDSFQDISLWLLLLTLFGLNREQRWLRWTKVLAILYLTSQAIDCATFFPWEHAGLGLQWVDAIATTIYSLTPLFIFLIVGFGLRRKRQMTVWPTAIAAFLYGAYNITFNMSGQGRRFTHWTLNGRMAAWGIHVGAYSFSAPFLLDLLLFIVLLVTVGRYQFMERRRQSEIELEVKSAREVQHVLVPEETPAIPGYSVASVYKPAAEVGGDFFQVMPQENGGALIVVGDVSGKGLKAAMTVSLIVGTLRTLADYTQQPAEILRGLNRRLVGRIDGGFATCVVLHLAANGETTVANGGHLAPFRDGKELPVTGSLPLGISTSATYDELTFRLQEGETLTLYTDGIIEARNRKGELFGFDRLSTLLATRPEVGKIVDAAEAFGQEDDITALSITRHAAGAPKAATVSLTTQIATA
ncbi:MAG TPA: PP2C family protein-serine/threonine phosphatase [Acidobacteriaceae bacterium]|nr:PP2C family protein-serine/threonine phosphatase [Acidobacteriaceae bacterium]